MEADVLVIGSGPAGIQAAIHAARKKVSVVLVGRKSGSAMNGTHVENYFAVDGAADGKSMLETGLKQAEGFGCRVLDENVVSAERSGRFFKIMTENDVEITAKAVVIATGISRLKLGIPGEKEFFGKGVSYCASCDCNFYKGKTVVIAGDDTEAAASAALMTKYASKTYWVAEEIKASETMLSKARSAGVEIISAAIKTIDGEGRVSSVTLSDGRQIGADGVFIELGAKSSADLAMDMDVMPETDDTIKVNSECATETEGVFACGDVTGKPWQVAKAVGQGAVAGISAADYARGV